MHFPVKNKRNREFWENQAFWVLLPLRLVAEGKSDANFSLIISSVLYTFSEISVSNDSSIAIFPSFIYLMYGWHIVKKDFHGFKIDMHNVRGVY